jgi:hypothetical protein
VLEYRELIGEPARALARGEAQLGLPATGQAVLLRERYTRDDDTGGISLRFLKHRARLARRAVSELGAERFGELLRR